MLDFSQFFLYFKTYGWNGGGINVDDVSQEPNGRELAVQAAGRGDRDGVYLGLISAGQAGQSVSDSDLFRLLVKADNSAIERYSREAEEAGRRNDQDGVQAAQVMLEAHRERLVMDGRELISSQTPPLHPEAASLEFWQASWDKVRQGESAGSPDGLLITAFHVASKGGRVDDGDLYRSLSQEYGAKATRMGEIYAKRTNPTNETRIYYQTHIGAAADRANYYQKRIPPSQPPPGGSPPGAGKR